MAKGAKLKDALDRHKEVDHKLEHQHRLQKKAEKRKRARAGEADVDDKPVVAANGKANVMQDDTKSSKRRKTEKGSAKKAAPVKPVDEGDDSESESEAWQTDDDGAEPVTQADKDDEIASDGLGDEDESMEDNEEEEDDADGDIPLSDIESLASEDKGDIIPHQRLTINNKSALTKAYKSISLPSDLPFTANQVIVTQEPVAIADVEDDLNRELAFYKQSLDAVTRARALLKAENAPFTRPTDYFAEMVKSDEHMGRIKSKLVGEAASKKAAAEARKQRDLKKFGKQVQVAKLQERDRAKRETLDKIKMLKKSTLSSVLLHFLQKLTFHRTRWCRCRQQQR